MDEKTTSEAPETWRVVVEVGGGRASHEMTVTREAEAFGGHHFRAECRATGGVAHGTTARQAVNRIAHLAGWDVVEILAPGETTRATLAAEKERVANLLTDRLEAELDPLAWGDVGWSSDRPEELTLSLRASNGSERRAVIPASKVDAIVAARKLGTQEMQRRAAWKGQRK